MQNGQQNTREDAGCCRGVGYGVADAADDGTSTPPRRRWSRTREGDDEGGGGFAVDAWMRLFDELGGGGAAGIGKPASRTAAAADVAAETDVGGGGRGGRCEWKEGVGDGLYASPAAVPIGDGLAAFGAPTFSDPNFSSTSSGSSSDELASGESAAADDRVVPPAVEEHRRWEAGYRRGKGRGVGRDGGRGDGGGSPSAPGARTNRLVAVRQPSGETSRQQIPPPLPLFVSSSPSLLRQRNGTVDRDEEGGGSSGGGGGWGSSVFGALSALTDEELLDCLRSRNEDDFVQVKGLPLEAPLSPSSTVKHHDRDPLDIPLSPEPMPWHSAAFAFSVATSREEWAAAASEARSFVATLSELLIHGDRDKDGGRRRDRGRGQRGHVEGNDLDEAGMSTSNGTDDDARLRWIVRNALFGPPPPSSATRPAAPRHRASAKERTAAAAGGYLAALFEAAVEHRIAVGWERGAGDDRTNVAPRTDGRRSESSDDEERRGGDGDGASPEDERPPPSSRPHPLPRVPPERSASHVRMAESFHRRQRNRHVRATPSAVQMCGVAPPPRMPPERSASHVRMAESFRRRQKSRHVRAGAPDAAQMCGAAPAQPPLALVATTAAARIRERSTVMAAAERATETPARTDGETGRLKKSSACR